MILLVVFIFGLIVGSFLNAVIFRLNTNESILFRRSDRIVGGRNSLPAGRQATASSTSEFTRSHCVDCNHDLSAQDLIPVISFLLLGGKCRYCGKKISLQYPLVELITAICFVLAVYNLQPITYNLQLGFELVMASFFIVIAVFDYKHYLILDKVVFTGLGLVTIWNIYQDVSTHYPLLTTNSHFVSGLAGAAVVSGFFGLQYLLSRGKWIGFGDVKFGLFLGSLFGLPFSLIMLFLSYILGAVVGVGLILFKRKTMDSQMPFGVFLSASAIIMLLYGKPLTDWYLGLIGF